MRYANSDTTELAKNNVAYGYQALMGSSTAANNVGGSNVAIGANTLMDCTSGNSNVAVGHNAGQNVTTGVRNVLVGFTAGDSITTGNNNTIIGDIAGTATLANTVIIGAGTAERLRIDSSGNVGIGTTSPTSRVHALSGASDNPHFHFKSTVSSGTNNSGDLFKIEHSRGTGNDSALLNVLNSAGSVLYVEGTGNVGIGTTPSQSLTLRGAQFIETNQMLIWQWNLLAVNYKRLGTRRHAAIYGKRVNGSNGYLRFDTRSSGTTAEGCVSTALAKLGLELQVLAPAEIAGSASTLLRLDSATETVG